MFRRIYRQHCAVRAASLIETLIALPVFLLLVLFLIDLVRFFLIYIGLNYAAHVAVDYASKVQVEQGTYAASTTPSGCENEACSTIAECQAYRVRVETILSIAMDKALLVAKPSSAPAGTTKLRRFRHYPTLIYGPGPTFAGAHGELLGTNAVESDAAFLRPFEQVEMIGYGPLVHSSRTYYPTASPTGWPDCAQGQTWAQFLNQEPLEVRFMLDFNWLTPLMGPSVVDVRAHAFRVTKVFGVGAPPVPAVTPTPSRTPTRTPTITFTPSIPPTATQTSTPSQTATTTSTPSQTFTPSITPTPSATPTASNTPTPSATATPTFTASNTPTPSITPTGTATFTASATPTITNTATATNTATITFTPSNTSTPSVTPTPSNTATPTRTRTPTSTATPTKTATPTVTNTPTPDCASVCGNPSTNPVDMMRACSDELIAVCDGFCGLVDCGLGGP